MILLSVLLGATDMVSAAKYYAAVHTSSVEAVKQDGIKPKQCHYVRASAKAKAAIGNRVWAIKVVPKPILVPNPPTAPHPIAKLGEPEDTLVLDR